MGSPRPCLVPDRAARVMLWPDSSELQCQLYYCPVLSSAADIDTKILRRHMVSLAGPTRCAREASTYASYTQQPEDQAQLIGNSIIHRCIVNFRSKWLNKDQSCFLLL